MTVCFCWFWILQNSRSALRHFPICLCRHFGPLRSFFYHGTVMLSSLFLIKLMASSSYEVNQSSYSAEIASQYLISPELKVKCWSGCSQPHCTLFSMHISKSCLEQFDKRIYNTRNFVRVLYLWRILKRCNFSQHRTGAKVRWPESGPTKFYCWCCNFHKNAFYLMLWHPDD